MRCLRLALAVLGTWLLLGVAESPVRALPEPPQPVPSESTGLIDIPPGCPSKPPADVAFVGTVLDKDGFIDKGTVRFSIDQVRAGNATPYSVNGMIDIRYGPDSQYLDVGTQYLVAAAVDVEIGALASKVSPAAPLFGGDAVIGLEDTEVVCPVIDDPVQTINLDGTPVEAGLLDPFFEDKRVLLATIGVPAAIVAAALVGLVLLRRALDLGFHGIFALGRAAVSPRPDHVASRVRSHADEASADRSEFGDGEMDDADGADSGDLVDAGVN